MIATVAPNAASISPSKIIHKSAILHPLARFVTEETVALMFNLQPEQIYRIYCWRYVVYIHAQGVSRFVSYADFPPTIEVEPPKSEDFLRWRKRWYKQSHARHAPKFWIEFYRHRFEHASSYEELRQWGERVGCIQDAIAPAALEQLRQIYRLSIRSHYDQQVSQSC